MATIERPNRQALIDALDIYRDAMRGFIVRNLKRLPRRKVDDAIKSALHDTQYNYFMQNISEGRSVEDAIDIGEFPKIVSSYWNEAFRNASNGEDFRNNLYKIAEARNKVSHPETQDVELDDAVGYLDAVAQALNAINSSEQGAAVNAIKAKLLPFKTPAHKFRQGGRDVYAFSINLPTLDELLPDRVDESVVKDANRPLTIGHARDIQKYLRERNDWLLGALLLGVSPSGVEFQSYTPDSDADDAVGELTIYPDGAADMKMFDGQHRRRAIKDVLYELSRNTAGSRKLKSLKDASMPVMLYAEDSIDALRQMFADAAQTRTIERNTVTRFDQRDAFNLAALWISEISDLFIAPRDGRIDGRVEMERASVARSSPNIIAINQLAAALKTLEVGYTGRVSRERNDEYMLDLEALYERCLDWSDDFMPAARYEYNDLMNGEIDNSEIPEKRAETMAYNAIVIRILAACYHEWLKKHGSDWQPLADFLQDASLRPGVTKGSLLVDAGVVAPGGTSPIAQSQTVVRAVEYIVNQAEERMN